MQSHLPTRPDLGQLRQQAKDLLRAAVAGQPEAEARLDAVNAGRTLSAAQLAIAREHGYPSWPRLKAEVERVRAIEHGDADGLRMLVVGEPALATEVVRGGFLTEPFLPLDYLAIGRVHGAWSHDRAGELARVLLDRGAAGPAGSLDTALILAASHGERDLVCVLLDAGADIEAVGRGRRGPSAPGSATALAHAVHYGYPDVVDVLVARGAVVHDVVEAAGAGDVRAASSPDASMDDRILALRAAAVCERLAVIDALVAEGVPIDAAFTSAFDDVDGATALHCAAYAGKAASVSHLLVRGADPNHRLSGYRGATPLDWCRYRQQVGVGVTDGHATVEAILAGLTGDSGDP